MKKGFSLIELVIAVSLASFVLVGVATIAAQMTRNQVEGIRSGSVTGWSVVSYMTMAKEIEEANVLVFPLGDGVSADSIVICKNWSRARSTAPGGKLDAAANVSVIQYCFDPVDCDPDPIRTSYCMRRYADVGFGVTCPALGAGPAACNAAGPGWPENGIVGARFEKLLPGPMNVFLRADSMGGVRVRYAIGAQVATPNVPVVKFTPFNFGISMQKQYSSAVD